MNNMKWIYSVFFVLVFIKINAQNSVSDSLDQYSFEELEKKAYNVLKVSNEAKYYAKIYLKKAKKINNQEKILLGYYLLSKVNYYNKLGVTYADSAIEMAKGINMYITESYILKGSVLYNQNDYREALKNYLKAYSIEEKNGNTKLLYTIKEAIGGIKMIWGDPKEAILYLKECVNYYDKKENKMDYINASYGLGECYRRLKEYDSAHYLFDKNIMLSNDSLYYSLNIKSRGINYFDRGDYVKAEKDLLESVPYLSKLENLNFITFSYLYLGKTYEKLEKKKKSIIFFRKVDSLIRLTNDFHPEFLSVYKPLINFYKAKNEYNESLYYLNRLLDFDSLYKSQGKFLNEKIVKEYEVPLLLSEKEKIIEVLKKDKKWFNYQKLILIISLCLALGLIIFYLWRNRLYRKRYKELMKIQQSKKNRKESFKNNIDKSLPEGMVDELLNKIAKFEDSNKFIKKYTLTSLARELNTNSSYLSKVINEYKKCNFTTYINDLRINYAIQQIQSDSYFRNYTIKAIAEECGFSSAQAFSRAFYKKTKIYPSYFLKETSKSIKLGRNLNL